MSYSTHSLVPLIILLLRSSVMVSGSFKICSAESIVFFALARSSISIRFLFMYLPQIITDRHFIFVVPLVILLSNISAIREGFIVLSMILIVERLLVFRRILVVILHINIFTVFAIIIMVVVIIWLTMVPLRIHILILMIVTEVIRITSAFLVITSCF